MIFCGLVNIKLCLIAKASHGSEDKSDNQLENYSYHHSRRSLSHILEHALEDTTLGFVLRYLTSTKLLEH
jgi:hypothetical protein